MLRQIILAGIATLILSFYSFTPVVARQGCCSWHGGVAYCDTAVGRYVCNDGTYSPSCGCYYEPPPVVITTPDFPQMNATWDFQPNPDGTYDVLVTLEDPLPSQYSISLSKLAGADPGPLVDQRSTTFTLYNHLPGRWYMNAKKDINGQWSNVAYWTVDIPKWVSPTPIPTPTTASIMVQSAITENEPSFTTKIIVLTVATCLIYAIFIALDKIIEWLQKLNWW